MNLKHFYYRTYFEGFGEQYPLLKLRQPENKDQRKDIEKENEPLLKARNQRLTKPLPAQAFTPTDLRLADMHTMKMEVQNPGLLTGAGYPHEVAYAGEFKLGFHFDHTGGLPVLPGSTVKGALRSLWPQYDYASTAPASFNADRKDANKAALQHKKAAFIFSLLKKAGLEIPANVQTSESIRTFVHRVELALFEGWNTLTIDGEEPQYLPGCKRAVFFDTFPVAPADSAVVPLLGRDALTPHGSDPLKNPIPLPFVKVLPGVLFEFRFRLRELPIQENITVSPGQLLHLFSDLLERTGIGAKTNVGYGHLLDPARMPARAKKEPAIQGGGQTSSHPDSRHANSPSGGIAPAPKRDVKNAAKWKPRDPIYGRVTEHQGKDVLFQSEQIAEPDWLIVVKNAPLPDRLVAGKMFKLSVSSINFKERRVLATVADFTALNE